MAGTYNYVTHNRHVFDNECLISLATYCDEYRIEYVLNIEGTRNYLIQKEHRISLNESRCLMAVTYNYVSHNRHVFDNECWISLATWIPSVLHRTSWIQHVKTKGKHLP